ncbi:pilus assembly protein TadG-related protein [Saccharopolyspora phatthalungensis]|uniref:Flp pilus assembly protein TadG n=1 Tax=Saccharopolyspora phatthalungensis TaxID=664693 RepID=A0A840QFG3_9PSEU|nr:pilus assembly protein TadG-related protein [Saccharopolyspora phatthalungensis]MBB5157458.1 Flp pilus assembly protein TadG [Saccharopolyspora phatthalungensis]
MTGHAPPSCTGRVGSWLRGRRQWWGTEEGRVSAFVVTLVVAIVAMAGLTLDGGLALAAKVRAGGHAEAAARAGAQALDLNAYRASGTMRLVPDQAVAEAQSYLARVGATGTVSVSGDTVTVAVTSTQRTQLLGLVGISSLPVHGSGSAHPQRGVVGISRGFANSEVDGGGNSREAGAG